MVDKEIFHSHENPRFKDSLETWKKICTITRKKYLDSKLWHNTDLVTRYEYNCMESQDWNYRYLEKRTMALSSSEDTEEF